LIAFPEISGSSSFCSGQGVNDFLAFGAMCGIYKIPFNPLALLRLSNLKFLVVECACKILVVKDAANIVSWIEHWAEETPQCPPYQDGTVLLRQPRHYETPSKTGLVSLSWTWRSSALAG
jgi:hypothetical protein